MRSIKQEDMLKTVYREMVNALQGAGVETPDLDARIIIEERCGYDWSDIIARGHSLGLDEPICQKMRKDVAERINGKPISRIYNKREFWGLEFSLSEDTLDPRPDTELIIELALQRFSNRKPPKHILDMGTGSGCILTSLLTEFPDSYGVGTDLSSGALDMARYNAQQNGCGSRASFYQGSWWNALELDHSVSCAADEPAHKVQQKYDLIVSNPPYITNRVIGNLAPEVKNHDPILSLDGGDDGLDAYKIILSKLETHLSDEGIALLEIGYDQEKDVMRLSEESGFALRTVHIDLAGNPRVVDISRGDK